VVRRLVPVGTVAAALWAEILAVDATIRAGRNAVDGGEPAAVAAAATQALLQHVLPGVPEVADVVPGAEDAPKLLRIRHAAVACAGGYGDRVCRVRPQQRQEHGFGQRSSGKRIRRHVSLSLSTAVRAIVPPTHVTRIGAASTVSATVAASSVCRIICCLEATKDSPSTHAPREVARPRRGWIRCKRTDPRFGH
jgi:hypothetical protein